MIQTPSAKKSKNPATTSGKKKNQSSLLNFFGTPTNNNKTPSKSLAPLSSPSFSTPTKSSGSKNKTGSSNAQSHELSQQKRLGEKPVTKPSNLDLKYADSDEESGKNSKISSQESSTTFASKNELINNDISFPPNSKETTLSQDSDPSPGKRVCELCCS